MIESIDKVGEIRNSTAPLSRYLRPWDPATNYWFSKLPQQEKYLKHEEIEKVVNQIRWHRRFMSITIPGLMISMIIILLLI